MNTPMTALDIAAIQTSLSTGQTSLATFLQDLHAQIDADDRPEVWIHREPLSRLLERAQMLGALPKNWAMRCTKDCRCSAFLLR